MLTFIIICSDV